MSRFVAPVNTYTPAERSPVVVASGANVPRGAAPSVVAALTPGESAAATTQDETQRWVLRAARDKVRADAAKLAGAQGVSVGPAGAAPESSTTAGRLVEAALRAKMRALDGAQSYPGQAPDGGVLSGGGVALAQHTPAQRSWAEVTRGVIPPDFRPAGAAAVLLSRGVKPF